MAPDRWGPVWPPRRSSASGPRCSLSTGHSTAIRTVVSADIDGVAEVVDAGDAWLELGGAIRTGRVLASFRRAVYVDVGGAVVALVSVDAPPGPLHLRVDPLPQPAPGSLIRVDARLPSSARWCPPVIDDRDLRRRASAAAR